MTTDPEGAVRLLAAILAGIPALPGAACRDRWELFDASTSGHHEAAEAAVAICARCPVLTTCQAWAAHDYPQKRPAGVLAGVYTPPAKTRKARIA